MPLRIPFDSLTLRAAVDEMRRLLVGGQIQHVSQPAVADLVLSVRGRGATHMLLLSCEADSARAHLTVAKRPNPATAPAFCMLCRKYVEGGRIADVRQRGFDRILDIEIAVGDGQAFTLIAELMGKHSNLILINEEGTILDAAKRITHRINRLREVLPGKRYVSPPSQGDRVDPLEADAGEAHRFIDSLPTDPEAQSARWMGHFAGISPFLAEELILRSQADGARQAWDFLFEAAKAGKWQPVIVRNDRSEIIGAYPFPTVQADQKSQFERDSINVALDHYFGAAIPRAALDAARHELQTTLARTVKSREKHRESLERSISESSRAEEYREAGELLLANLHRMEASSEWVEVDDYYRGGGPRRIALDPAKAPRENAEAYFRRYRKAKDGLQIQQQQLEKVEADLHAMREALAGLPDVTDLAGVKALRRDLQGQGLLRGGSTTDKELGPGQRAPDFNGKKIRVFQSPEGWDIYLGENSEANDHLTGRVASPNDWWVHVRANASAHVVIRTRNNPASVPMSVIHRAAILAAQHSASKHAEIVPVDYTLKKYVRRPKGSPSGAALYQHEKTIYVNPKRD